MKKSFFLLILFMFIACFQKLSACSLVKITVDGKTMVGNNEDAWTLNPKIWFEVGGDDSYGAAYVGHRNNYPQGGLNEAGLMYDGFMIYSKELKDQPGKKGVDDSARLLKQVMQTCATVEEVHELLNQYDLSRWNGALTVFVDRSGKYLLVEADTMIVGNDPWYVQVNDRPSEGRLPEDFTASRYHKARRLLKARQEADYAFAATVMDSMASCEERLGEGTLYTNVFDLNEGLIYLYFYHEFSHVAKLNLKDELAKGNHVIHMTSLFPANEDYANLENYKTPLNSSILLKWISLSIILVILSSFYFFVESIRIWIKKGKEMLFRSYHFSKVLIMINSLMLVILLLFLMRYDFIFYSGFGKSPTDLFLYELAAFFPLLISLITIVSLVVNYRIIKDKLWVGFSRWVFVGHTAVFLVFPFLFIYWNILIPS